MTTESVFWTLIGIIIYSYIGYGIILMIMSLLKKIFNKKENVATDHIPEVTLFISAYNEKEFVGQKINNSFNLNYPKDKLHIVFVTDGSDDGTPELLKKYDGITLYHKDERNGKIGAINRGMKFVVSPIVVFSDCNTMLAKDSIKEIVALFQAPKVGCVAGEKRITNKQKDIAVNSGEGLYWKYESWLKKTEANVNTTIGAAGELFAIRRELFKEVEKDTLLDDFIISLRIAAQGYKIKYTPKAYATETASASIKEEMKRKIRISSGSFQTLIRMKKILNPFKYGTLTLQYISHKVLRWTIIPLSIPFIFFLNAYIAYYSNQQLYKYLFIFQVVFYLLVLMGRLLENRKTRIKIFFVPYYIFLMNLSVYIGFFRYVNGTQSHNWERALRGK